uniref:hypothetical protein n=1 Tax=Roseovarius indicus TaxID=540747 RepID=UPI003B51C845
MFDLANSWPGVSDLLASPGALILFISVCICVAVVIYLLGRAFIASLHRVRLSGKYFRIEIETKPGTPAE